MKGRDGSSSSSRMKARAALSGLATYSCQKGSLMLSKMLKKKGGATGKPRELTLSGVWLSEGLAPIVSLISAPGALENEAAGLAIFGGQ